MRNATLPMFWNRFLHENKIILLEKSNTFYWYDLITIYYHNIHDYCIISLLFDILICIHVFLITRMWLTMRTIRIHVLCSSQKARPAICYRYKPFVCFVVVVKYCLDEPTFKDETRLSTRVYFRIISQKRRLLVKSVLIIYEVSSWFLVVVCFSHLLLSIRHLTLGALKKQK